MFILNGLGTCVITGRSTGYLTELDGLRKGTQAMLSLSGRASRKCVANFVGADYGVGYRVYYKDTGNEIIILLCGGDKTTQQEDIAKAKRIAVLPLEEEE